MFQINEYIIVRMGWKAYSPFHVFPIVNNHNLFGDDDELIKYFFKVSKRKLLYVIKELTDEEKQIGNKSYKFIVVDYSTEISNGEIEFKTFEIDSNQELFKLIIEHEACKDNYTRHFRINKLFRK